MRTETTDSSGTVRVFQISGDTESQERETPALPAGGQESSYFSGRVISVLSLLPRSITAPHAESTRPSLHFPLLGQAFLKHKLIKADLRSPAVRRASAIDMMSDLAQLAAGRQEPGWICCGSPAPQRNCALRALTRGRSAQRCLSALSGQPVHLDR